MGKIGAIAKGTLGAALAGAALYGANWRITHDRVDTDEIVLVERGGEIIAIYNEDFANNPETGWKRTGYPIINVVRTLDAGYSAYDISADDAQIMTSDQQQFIGSFEAYVRPQPGANEATITEFRRLYWNERETIIRGVLRSAAQEVIGQRAAADFPQALDSVLNQIMERAQEKLDEQGIPYEVGGVSSKGLALHDDARQILRRTIQTLNERRVLLLERENLEIESQNAVMRSAVALDALNTLIEGVEEDITVQVQDADGSIRDVVIPAQSGLPEELHEYAPLIWHLITEGADEQLEFNTLALSPNAGDSTPDIIASPGR